MELYELTQKVKTLFGVDELSQLGVALSACLKEENFQLMDRFVELVDGDLTVDWLQKIFQYNLADRKEKKQDFTPKCLALFLSALIGDSSTCIDLCAGTGALTIQRSVEYPDMEFELYEIDESVIPYLLFNLAVRNINATVHVGDALAEEETATYQVKRGEKYAKVLTL